MFMIVFIFFNININENFDVYNNKKNLPNELSGVSILQCGNSNGDPPPFYRFENNKLYRFPSRDSLKQSFGFSSANNQDIRNYVDNFKNSLPSNERDNLHTYWIKKEKNCKKYTSKYPVQGGDVIFTPEDTIFDKLSNVFSS